MGVRPLGGKGAPPGSASGYEFVEKKRLYMMLMLPFICHNVNINQNKIRINKT